MNEWALHRGESVVEKELETYWLLEINFIFIELSRKCYRCNAHTICPISNGNSERWLVSILVFHRKFKNWIMSKNVVKSIKKMNTFAAHCCRPNIGKRIVCENMRIYIEIRMFFYGQWTHTHTQLIVHSF